jgi:hypothetical protein
MPTALTHTRITWALSTTAAQVPMSLRGPPYAHGVSNTPHGEVCDRKGAKSLVYGKPS